MDNNITCELDPHESTQITHSDGWLTFEELLAGVPLRDRFPIALAILGVRTAPPPLLTPLEDPTVIQEKTHPCIT